MMPLIIDSTLRDGEQRAGISLDIDKKVQIAQLLNYIGIDQIEAGIPAMNSIEKESVKKIVNLNLNSKISAWNRMNIMDIEKSMDCGVDIIHISVPTSNIHLKSKLKKSREWVSNQMSYCIDFVKEKGFAVSIGFEDASRADLVFLLQLGKIACEKGVYMIRYADTVGVLHPQRVFEEFRVFTSKLATGIGIHAHNDFGMAVANSLAAAECGAKFVDCTFGGIGERAGNCSFVQFVEAFKEVYNLKIKYNISQIKQIEEEVIKICKA